MVERFTIDWEYDHGTPRLVRISTPTGPFVQHSDYATLEAEVSRLTALLDEAKAPTHRHKKRGIEYVLIGIGKMQAEDWADRKGKELPSAIFLSPVDMREVAIYRSVDDGALWVRPREEFEDGRFEEIARAFAEKAGA